MGSRFPRTSLAVPLLAIPFALLSMTTYFAPLSRASGVPGAISFTPTNGPVGTQVTVSINPPAGTYTLGVTTTSPTAGGCAKAQPLPGVAPVSVGEGGGGATFTWPSAFSQGAYWLCGTPQGPGQTAASHQSFLVIVPGAPTPTPLPATGPTATIQISTPTAGVVVGSNFTVLVMGWSDRSGEPPLSVSLSAENPTAIPSDGERIYYISVPSTITAQDNHTGNYTLRDCLESRQNVVDWRDESTSSTGPQGLSKRSA